jgi:DnaK suppressor protein
MATKKKTKKTAKKKITKKAVKKKTPAKKVKKASKPAAKKPKAKKTPTKKKITKKTSAAKKTKVAPKKAAARKKAPPVKKADTAIAEKKPKKKLRALPKLGPETLKIRERLLAKRSDLLKLIQSSKSLERDVGDLTFSNEIDLASSLEGREMLFQLTSRDRNELRLIEEALFRINEGTFGACESCEEQISLKRLQIMPLTPLCISCQEAAENL